jgi:hypothetical protein
LNVNPASEISRHAKPERNPIAGLREGAPFRHFQRYALGASCAALLAANRASAADTNPVPAGGKIFFERDVRPIFEADCFRCHGPQKPKSHFRLDLRSEALKGGDDNTNDIVPGHADQSALIRYVSGLDPNVQMPPAAIGKPLTSAQVSVLKTWIDEGAAWGTNAPAELSFTVTTEVSRLGVAGNQGKFRELEGIPDGVGGGLSYFSLVQQLAPDEKFSLEGHALAPENDYKVVLGLDCNNVGFIHGGFEEWRKYYADSGGFAQQLSPPSYSLNRDLYLDNGRFWVDLGLTPRQGPQVVLGYEYLFRQGDEASLAWGTAGQSAEIKSIYPNTEKVDEHTQVLKLDITDDWLGWEIEDHARGEFYQLGESRNDLSSFPILGASQSMNQRVNYTQGEDSFLVTRQVTEWWRVSAGGLYSRYDGTSDFDLSGANATGAPISGASWQAQGVTLERDSRVVSLASLLQPVRGLTLSAASQAEWTHEAGMGEEALDFGIPSLPIPGTISANQNQTEFSEQLEANFNRLPRTVLFAEARLQQESIQQSDAADGAIAAYDGVPAIGEQTDTVERFYDARAGFTTSPWSWLEFGGYARIRDSHTSYNDLAVLPGNGYPGFITDRDIALDEIEGHLVLRPVSWLNARLTYRWNETRYTGATGGATNFDGSLLTPEGPLFDGRTRSDNLGLSLTYTPGSRFYCSGAFTYGYSRTTTVSDEPEVVPYSGNTYTLDASAGFALNAKTRLKVTYEYSQATYGQNNLSGLPLGLAFTRQEVRASLTRQLTKRLTGSLQYQFSQYNEPSGGNVNNFTANGIFATLAWHWR